MAVHTVEISEMTSGFSKGIEASAMGLIMDNLQKYQYQYPVKSTVREIVSNGIDSIADRNAAVDILNGAPLDKYFVEDKDDPLFQHSKFDPNYYDRSWLSTDNLVYIDYHEGKNQEYDKVVITDHGTGLGGRRLQGYFQLGYSTKRLSKMPLGKFGIGAKSALSVAKFYTVESRYNGKLFRFNIYSSDVDSIIPRYDLVNEKENAHELFGEGPNAHVVYYEDTTEKNGVTVMIEAKKHHQAQYIDAVKTQLLYFDNIVFRIHRTNGTVETVSHKASVIYEDDNIILSDNKIWSRPHLLLNRVNYGYINWDELEMEGKYGNIGIKVRPEDVEVNPSRESVIWSEETKAMVLKRFNDVVNIATSFIEKELKEQDFVKWLRTCYQILASCWNSPDDSIVQRLSRIVDLSQIEPRFTGDKTLQFNQYLFVAFNVRLFSFLHSKKANNKVLKVEREKIYGLQSYNHLPIVLMDSAVSVRKDKYLLKHVYTSGFVGITVPEWIDEKFGDNVVITRGLVHDLLKLKEDDEVTPYHKEAIRNASSLYYWLSKSDETIHYSDVDVPDSFTSSDEDEETEEDEEKSAVVNHKIQSDVRRKLEGKTIVSEPYYQYHQFYRKNLNENSVFHTWVRTEIPIARINDWDNEEIFYGNEADAEVLSLAAFITRVPTSEPRNNSQVVPDKHPIRLIKVAQSTNRLFSDFKHIQEFFISVKKTSITMSNALVKWNTARLLLPRINEVAFMWNFAPFDKKRADTYRSIVEYVKTNYNEVGQYAVTKHAVTEYAYTSLINHLDSIHKFQKFVASGPSKEELATVAKEMFDNASISSAVSVDPVIWAEFEDLCEFAIPIKHLLNEVEGLTGLSRSQLLDEPDQFLNRDECVLCSEVEQTIQGYLQIKGVF